ncbi:hypothetical protein Hanom_Chr00s000001g01594671 [Helianthus anomalus]
MSLPPSQINTGDWRVTSGDRLSPATSHLHPLVFLDTHPAHISHPQTHLQRVTPSRTGFEVVGVRSTRQKPIEGLWTPRRGLLFSCYMSRLG